MACELLISEAIVCTRGLSEDEAEGDDAGAEDIALLRDRRSVSKRRRSPSKEVCMDWRDVRYSFRHNLVSCRRRDQVQKATHLQYANVLLQGVAHGVNVILVDEIQQVAGLFALWPEGRVDSPAAEDVDRIF